jgi:hypothetical protein
MKTGETIEVSSMNIPDAVGPEQASPPIVTAESVAKCKAPCHKWDAARNKFL